MVAVTKARWIICPQLTIRGSPKPRKLTPASAITAQATPKAPYNRERGRTFGSRCPYRMRTWLPPAARTARTKGRSFRLSTWARMTRAHVRHIRIEIEKMMLNRLGPEKPGQHDRKGDEGDAEGHVRQAHEGVVHPAAEITRQEPDVRPDHDDEQSGHHTDDDGHPGPRDGQAEYVPTIKGGPQPVLGRGGRQRVQRAVCPVLIGHGLIADESLGCEGEQKKNEQEDSGQDAGGLAADQPDGRAEALSGRRRLGGRRDGPGPH